MVKCPYDELTLQIATLSIREESLSEDRLGRVQETMASVTVPKGKAELNRVVAAENGVSVEALIASQNYQLLVDEYRQLAVAKLVAALERECDLTNKQAWAIVVSVFGALPE